MIVMLVAMIVVQSLALGALAVWVVIVARWLVKIDRDGEYAREYMRDMGLKLAKLSLELTIRDMHGPEDGR